MLTKISNDIDNLKNTFNIIDLMDIDKTCNNSWRIYYLHLTSESDCILVSKVIFDNFLRISHIDRDYQNIRRKFPIKIKNKQKHQTMTTANDSIQQSSSSADQCKKKKFKKKSVQKETITIHYYLLNKLNLLTMALHIILLS